MSLLLEVRDLHAWYASSHILRGVNLSVAKGEIVSLLGRNGAGRSTLAKALMGMVRASGSVCINGQAILGRRTFEIARLGMGYVPENRDIFPTLTVEQNLLLGEKHALPSRWSLQDMYRLFPGLHARRNTAGGVLSGGEQQMLTLCRTLMGDPECLVVDEPTEGLAPKLVEQLALFLRELQGRGVGVLLIEQKLAIALEVAQRVYVMGHGSIVFEGTPQQLLDQPAIRREWLEI